MKRILPALTLFAFLLCCSMALAQPVASVTVSVPSADDTICAGSAVTITATPVNGGVNPSYAWFVNGNLASLSGGSYTTDSLPVGTPYIYCVMESNLVGVTGNPATSDTIYLDVLPRPTAMISDSDTICKGQVAGLTVSLTNGGPWQLIYSAGSAPDTVSVLSSPYTISASPSLTTSYHITAVKAGSCPALPAGISGTGLIVVDPVPVAIISALADSSQCLSHNSFDFNGTHSTISGGTIASWTWSFGALSPDTASGASPVVHFSDTGSGQPVVLIVTSSKGCSDTSSIHVSVIPSPGGSFSVTDTAICAGAYLITQASATSDSIYMWSWGDGTDSSCQCFSLLHTYSTYNDKRLKLSVTGSNGCTDTSSLVVHVHALPVAAFTVNDTIQCYQGNSFSFTDHSTLPVAQQYHDSVLSYSWNFGDGSPSDTLMDPVYSYATNAHNTYSVIEVVTTDFGCTGSEPEYLTVYQTPSVQITCSEASDTVCAGLSYQLTAVTNATRPSYIWSIPDSTSYYIDGLSQASGNLSNTVNYLVTVTDTANNKCTNTAVLSVICVPNVSSPVINDGIIPVACDSSSVFFFASNASDSEHYFWYTSPALPISGQNDSHSDITFTAADSMVLVYLAATNIWGCSARSLDTIRPVAASAPSVSVIGVPDLSDTTLIASVTPDSGITYQWGYDIGGTGFGLISGATTQSLLLDSGQNSASYWVMVVDTITHCTAMGYLVPPVTTTSIADINGLNAEISVFPNPAAEVFKVHIRSATEQSWSLDITDISGRQMSSTTISKEQNTIWEINASSWTEGAYLLRIRSASGHIKVLKLIRE